ARPPRGPRRARGSAQAFSRVGGRLGQCRAGTYLDRARVGASRREGTLIRRHEMSELDRFDYRGKRALVVGGATGMGAAVAEMVLELGAEVVVMDRAKITLAGARALSLDLAEKESIDRALTECGGRVDALFSCAGVADGTPGIERINFIGHRYMIDRMFAAGMFSKGAAI